MRTVVIIGATEPLGLTTLEVIGRHRGEFIVDGLVDSGANPTRLAELVVEFTPLRLGVLDEYAAGAVLGERDDIRLDAGLVEWELADLDLLTGPQASTELAAMPTDIVVVALSGDGGRTAAEAAAAQGTQLVLVADELPDADAATIAALLGVAA